MSESLVLLCCAVGVTGFLAAIVGYVVGYRAALLFRDSLAAAPVRGEGEALPGREAAGASPCAAVPAREGAETDHPTPETAGGVQ